MADGCVLGVEVGIVLGESDGILLGCGETVASRR
jgi:hypothetical protein